MIVAYDIETCPQRLPDLSDRQRRRYEKLLKRELEQNPDADPDEAGRKVRSLNAFLGWICCISVVRYDPRKQHIGKPKSYAVGLYTQEDDLLARFWHDLTLLPRNTTWLTFNGKRFDVDFLLTRTLARGLNPTRIDLLNRNPYDHRNHVDLATLFRSSFGLADLCDLLGVESPKTGMDGSGVYEAVKQGRIADVAQYCEGDVLATLHCYLKAQPCFA